MMVTALSPITGHDKAPVISHDAIDHDLTLKKAALDNGVSEELYEPSHRPAHADAGRLSRPGVPSEARLARDGTDSQAQGPRTRGPGVDRGSRR
jgi:hypothetical protein